MSINMICKIIFLFFIFTGIAAADAVKPIKILFLGNSYTYFNDMPKMFKAIVESSEGEGSVEVEEVAMPGISLADHWYGGAQDRIKSKNWDYVVLQEQSMLPAGSPGRFHEYVRRLSALIKGIGAKTVLYVTWARDDAPESQQNKIDDSFDVIGKEVGALLAPVGKAWKEINQKQKGNLSLYSGDPFSHPSAQGSYITAVVFYSLILGKEAKATTYGRALMGDNVDLTHAVAFQLTRHPRP